MISVELINLLAGAVLAGLIISCWMILTRKNLQDRIRGILYRHRYVFITTLLAVLLSLCCNISSTVALIIAIIFVLAVEYLVLSLTHLL